MSSICQITISQRPTASVLALIRHLSEYSKHFGYYLRPYKCGSAISIVSGYREENYGDDIILNTDDGYGVRAALSDARIALFQCHELCHQFCHCFNVVPFEDLEGTLIICWASKPPFWLPAVTLLGEYVIYGPEGVTVSELPQGISNLGYNMAGQYEPIRQGFAIRVATDHLPPNLLFELIKFLVEVIPNTVIGVTADSPESVDLYFETPANASEYFTKFNLLKYGDEGAKETWKGPFIPIWKRIDLTQIFNGANTSVTQYYITPFCKSGSNLGHVFGASSQAINLQETIDTPRSRRG